MGLSSQYITNVSNLFSRARAQALSRLGISAHPGSLTKTTEPSRAGHNHDASTHRTARFATPGRLARLISAQGAAGAACRIRVSRVRVPRMSIPARPGRHHPPHPKKTAPWRLVRISGRSKCPRHPNAAIGGPGTVCTGSGAGSFPSAAARPPSRRCRAIADRQPGGRPGAPPPPSPVGGSADFRNTILRSGHNRGTWYGR